MEFKPWRLSDHLLELTVLWHCFMNIRAAEEARECREQEYSDTSGNCLPCIHCGPGQELSMECGFGFGEGARCVPCRTGRYKEDAGLQKCKLCLACAGASRLQTSNCTATGNAVCSDCLPGFYRRTRLSGFQDMECVPCGDPGSAHEPQCSSRVNLVPLSSVASSPHDTALVSVICSALASVLLALLLLCAIYCKRQLERKPSSTSSALPCSPSEPGEDGSHYDADFPCFDHIQVGRVPDSCHQNTCSCYQVCGHTTSGVLPSQCCEEHCSLGPVDGYCLCYPQISYNSLLNPAAGCQGCHAWELQTGPLENMLSEGSQDLSQDDERVPGEELKLDGVLIGDVMHNTQALDSLTVLSLR